MKQYITRAVKYFLSLCVLCIALMALMLLTGTSAMTLDQMLYVAIHTERFALMFGAIAVLALFYPRFGFVVRNVEGSVEQDREQIINAFKATGFELCDEKDGVMRFRAEGFVKRLLMLFEDEILVSQSGDSIRMEGIRRGIARIEYRLESYIQMKRRND